jgi:putative two-component system response regulator
LSGAEIPIEARVIAVADTYDVLTSDRPYRRALNCVDAMTRVREAAGVHLDAVVVEALVRALALRPRYLSVA